MSISPFEGGISPLTPAEILTSEVSNQRRAQMRRSPMDRSSSISGNQDVPQLLPYLSRATLEPNTSHARATREPQRGSIPILPILQEAHEQRPSISLANRSSISRSMVSAEI